MSDQNMFNSNEEKTEKEFEKDILDALPEIPPADILKKVIPCRRAMNFIIAGFALSTIRIDLLWLQFILPLLGFIFLIIGFRTLSYENSWFRLCKISAVVLNVFNVFDLGINATVYHETFSASVYGRSLMVINAFVMILLLIFFAEGLRELQQKAGIKPHTGFLIMMMLWYFITAFLGFVEAEAGLLGFIFVILYILFLISLNKVAKALYASGYAIKTMPVKMSDKWIYAIVLSAAVVSISCGLIFFNSYPMDWTPVPENEHSEVEDVKAHLLKLGFPENVLNDLSDEDIMSCKGALDLTKKVEERPMNSGREVVEEDLGTIRHSTVYDVKELVVTHILIKLPSDNENKIRWRVFHYFYWKVDPGFCGTDVMEIWTPKNDVVNSFEITSDITGRVMYNKDGQNYSSPYYSVSNKVIVSSFGYARRYENPFLEFSLPKDGDSKRCYVTYEFEQIGSPVIISCWVNYVHQKNVLMYPVVTASEFRSGGSISNFNFRGTQTAIQVDSDNIHEDMFGSPL